MIFATVWLLACRGADAATLVADYPFNNSLASVVASAPDLALVGAVKQLTDPIFADGFEGT